MTAMRSSRVGFSPGLSSRFSKLNVAIRNLMGIRLPPEVLVGYFKRRMGGSGVDTLISCIIILLRKSKAECDLNQKIAAFKGKACHSCHVE
jgi:hypothetical protein